jgi:t-SNARE complex subunit (syntaxin)
MSKENNDNQDILPTNDSEEINAKAQSAIAELSFNTRAMGYASDEFTKSLAKANTSIQKILSDFEQCVIKQEQNVDKINTESRVLCLIPEKIEERLNKIAPQIATEVEAVYNSKIIELNNRFETLHNKLNQDFEDCRQKLSATTDRCIDQLSNTTEKFTFDIDRKLIDFSQKLTQAVGAVSNQKTIRFVKYLAFILLFSALVSGGTSYLVATQFPRYVEVKGANDLIINDSKVKVWGAKLLDQKEDTVKKVK